MAETSLKDTAYRYIKDKINMCQYLPGESVNELRIAEEMKIGRMPVREALSVLKLENLIEVRPRKGTYVKMITREDVQENYQIRRILEPAVIAEYIKVYNKAVLLDFDSQFEHLDLTRPADIYTLDIDFHRYLVEICANARIKKLYEVVLEAQFRMGIYNSLMHTNETESYYEEHHDIIMALLHEDKKHAAEAVIYHINQSQISSLKSIQNSKEA